LIKVVRKKAGIAAQKTLTLHCAADTWRNGFLAQTKFYDMLFFASIHNSTYISNACLVHRVNDPLDVHAMNAL
jgi:hypothetical protein